MLQMKSLSVGELSTCCYIVWDDASDACVVIDPGAEPERIRKACEGRRIEAILLTPNMMCDHVSCMVTDPLFKQVAEKCAKRQNEGTLDLYVNTAKEIAAKHGAAICDCYTKWKTMNANGVNTTRLLANYINHPTREMNKLFATSLLETMMN